MRDHWSGLGRRPGSRNDCGARVGGVITSFVLELLIYPVIFTIWKGWRLTRAAEPVSSTDNAAHPGGPFMTTAAH
jgi:hypothetical protein